MSYVSAPDLKNRRLTRTNILTGGRVSLKLTDEMHKVLENRVRVQDSLSNITKAIIFPSFVLFTDNTAWVGGTTLYPEPGKENSWVPKELTLNTSTEHALIANSKTAVCEDCGSPTSSIEICCINGGCSISYYRQGMVCSGASQRCCPYQGPACECFPGTYCTQCMYANCHAACEM